MTKARTYSVAAPDYRHTTPPRSYWGYVATCAIWGGLVVWAIPDGWVVMVPCILFGMALALSLRRFKV